MAKGVQMRGAVSDLANRTRPKRTPLFRWLSAHHAEVQAMIESQGGVNWVEFTKVMVERGMTDVTGKPVLRHTVKRTWYRVCAEIDAKALRPVSKPLKPAKLVAPRTGYTLDAAIRPPPVPAPKDAGSIADTIARMKNRFGRSD